MPLRGAAWIVSQEQTIFFTLLILVYLLLAGLFAWASVAFARQASLR